MKYIILLLSFAVFQSCIPVAIAPQLDEGKIMKGNKFKKKLPDRNAYIFSDPKNENEFYYYINTKFKRDHNYVEDNVPVEIDGTTYYISFFETGKKTKTFNLLRPIANEVLENNGVTRVFDEDPVRSSDSWYIVLLVTDENFNDALDPDYGNHSSIVAYTDGLRREYLSMSNYKQALLQDKGN